MIKDIIKIGGHDFDVTLVANDVDFSPSHDGITDYGRNTIKICSSTPKTRQEEVLAHECLHVLIDKSGAEWFLKDKRLSEKHVEDFIRILENTFYNFLKNNTDFYTKKEVK